MCRTYLVILQNLKNVRECKPLLHFLNLEKLSNDQVYSDQRDHIDDNCETQTKRFNILNNFTS